MSPLPPWLGPLTRLEDFDGDVELYIAHLFTIFTRDFIDTKPQFEGRAVFHDKTIDTGKPVAFTHITTEEDEGTKERVLCLRRCERLSWIKSIIENSKDPIVLLWKKEQTTSHRRTIRTYLFLEQEDFLVILEEIKWGHYMITAIYVDNPNQKRKHLKAYNAYKKANP